MGLLESMMEKLGYPYQVLPEKSSMDEVMAIYKEAVEKGKKEGFTPVIVPEDDVLDDYFGILKQEDGFDVQDTLQNIGNGGRELLQQNLKELTGPEEDDLEALDLNELMGEIGNGESIDGFYSLQGFYDDGKQVVLLEVPTDKPWEVVVYVPFGGWNECPAPDDMAAICK